MSSVKISTVHFSDEELALLDMIQGHTGVRSRTEAMRAVLKYYAEAKGLDGDKMEAEAPKPSK